MQHARNHISPFIAGPTIHIILPESHIPRGAIKKEVYTHAAGYRNVKDFKGRLRCTQVALLHVAAEDRYGSLWKETSPDSRCFPAVRRNSLDVEH